MQDAPRRACRTRRVLQDAPHRACRTRRTGHAAHAGHTPGSASHMPCPNPSIRLHAHITSTRRRHCSTPSGMQHAPRLHASTPCSPVSAFTSLAIAPRPQPRLSLAPSLTGRASWLRSILFTPHTCEQQALLFARHTRSGPSLLCNRSPLPLSIRFTQCTVSLAASPLHPTP